MRVLLLGYSEIARRRVLPALVTAGATAIDIASASAENIDWKPDRSLDVRTFRRYEAALDETRADLVYVSTVNSAHAPLAMAALERGFHVAIDKPAFLTAAEMQAAVELASSRQRLLAEATVWTYHPRLARTIEAFTEHGSEPTDLVATFRFPPLSPADFRYRAALGGGALWDLGPYAVTPGRLFFGAPPDAVAAQCLRSNGEVDVSFHALMAYPGGRSFAGSFGYTTGYLNRLEVLGPGMTATMDRVFSPPAGLATELILRRGNAAEVETIPPADNFALFFADVFQGIAAGSFRRFLDRMIADAAAMRQLRSASATVSAAAIS